MNKMREKYYNGEWRLLTPPELNHYITFYIKALQTISNFKNN